MGLVLHQQKSHSRGSKSEQHNFKVQGKAQQFNEPDLIQGGPHSKGFVYLKVITHSLMSLRHRHNAGYFIRWAYALGTCSVASAVMEFKSK